MSPLAYCDATTTTAGGTTYVCVNKPCNGESHYFVKAGSQPTEGIPA